MEAKEPTEQHLNNVNNSLEFHQEKAEEYINHLLKKYRIKVVKWSKSSCGCAWTDLNEVKIPKPTDIDRFGVCLHEIHHIMEGDTKDGKVIKRYEQEFYADMFARNTIIDFGYDTTEWDRRTQWHILSRIAMAINRGCKEINQEVAEYFNYIDFSGWFGNKVFVGGGKKFLNQTISINGLQSSLPFVPRNHVGEYEFDIKSSKGLSFAGSVGGDIVFLRDEEKGLPKVNIHNTPRGLYPFVFGRGKTVTSKDIERMKVFQWTDDKVLAFGKVVTGGSYGAYKGCKTMVEKLKRFKELNK